MPPQTITPVSIFDEALAVSDLPFINILDYGADPTGASDSAPAFRAAIDAAISSQRNRVIVVPPGIFTLNSIEHAPTGTLIDIGGTTDVSIVGWGPGSKLKPGTGITGDFALFRDAGGAANGFTISNLSVDLDGINHTQPSALSRYHEEVLNVVNMASRIVVDRLVVANAAGERILSFGNGGVSPNVKDVTIQNCHFETVADIVSGNGFAVDHSSIFLQARRAKILNNTFINATQSNISTAIEIHGQDVVVAGNIIEYYNLAAIIAGQYSDVKNVRWERSNRIKNCRGGIRFYLYAGRTMSGIDISPQGETASDSYPFVDMDYTGAMAASIDDVTISEFNIVGTASSDGDKVAGIQIGRCKDVKIRSGVVKGFRGRGITIGLNAGILTNETRLELDDIAIVDCSKTTDAAYEQGIFLGSANTLLELRDTDCRFINDSAAHMAVGISGNTPVARRISRGHSGNVSKISDAFSTPSTTEYVAPYLPAFVAAGANTDIDTVNPSYENIDSATVTFTPQSDIRVLVTASFDVQQMLNAGASVFAGGLDVDNVVQTGNVAFTGAVGDRGSVGRSWVVDLAAAVSHTIKLVGSTTGAAANNFRVYGGNTGFSITVLPRL
jgi:hypothetical protein